MILPRQYASNPDLFELDRLLVPNKFRTFVEVMWPAVSNDPFKTGYLVDCLCEHLQALHEGQVRRLAVACPIRHGKTIISQVLFSAWLWMRDPTLRLVCGTLSEKRAGEVATDTRHLLRSDLYQAFRPLKLQEDADAKLMYQNEYGGKRHGVGTGTKIGGIDADYILVDDLIDFHKARHESERTASIDFYTNHLERRLVAGTGKDRVLVAGHRCHQSDLFAHIYETYGNDGTWSYLVLPEEARPTITNDYHNGTGWKDTRAEGELLFPERFDRKWVDNERRMLRHEYHCVYQQDPTPQGGDLFKPDWFRSYTEEANHYVLAHGQTARRYKKAEAWRVITVDSAISTSSTADWTVAQCWDMIGSQCVLVDQLRKRLDGNRIVPSLAAFYDLHQPQFMAIEEEFVGRIIIDQLRERNVIVKPFSARKHGDKETRAVALEIRMEAGQVWYPSGKEWVADLQAEILAFPNGRHDDQVDCGSMMAVLSDKYKRAEPAELTPAEQVALAVKEKQERFQKMLWAGCPF